MQLYPGLGTGAAGQPDGGSAGQAVEAAVAAETPQPQVADSFPVYSLM